MSDQQRAGPAGVERLAGRGHSQTLPGPCPCRCPEGAPRAKARGSAREPGSVHTASLSGPPPEEQKGGGYDFWTNSGAKPIHKKVPVKLKEDKKEDQKRRRSGRGGRGSRHASREMQSSVSQGQADKIDRDRTSDDVPQRRGRP